LAETVEIRINVQNATREIVLESNQAPEIVAELINKAVDSGEILSLVDEKGRRIVVPGDKIAFVEIGAHSIGRVGFATD